MAFLVTQHRRGRFATDCASLASIYDSPPSVTSIGEEAFYELRQPYKRHRSQQRTNIEDFAFADGGADERHDPRGRHQHPGKRPFNGCSRLGEHHDPKSVTNIEKQAFYDCTSLNRITIPAGSLALETMRSNTAPA